MNGNQGVIYVKLSEKKKINKKLLKMLMACALIISSKEIFFQLSEFSFSICVRYIVPKALSYYCYFFVIFFSNPERTKH